MLADLARAAIRDSAEAISRADGALLARAARQMARRLAAGGTIFICGNGGSAAQAQHLAGELVGRFYFDRPGLPAVALTADTAVLTAVGNDYGFEEVFARQVRALGRAGDALWGLSTSGQSPNVLKALAAAREMGLATLLMCGAQAPEPAPADIILAAPTADTPRVQESHLLYGHTLCQLIEHLIFSAPGEMDKEEE